MGDLSANFSRSEFACKCNCGKDDIANELVDRLQLMRDMLGYSITPTSGVRCIEHNRSEGGVENSTHVRCIAVDTLVTSSVNRGEQVSAAIRAGFKYIGIGRNFLHLDLRVSDRIVMFDYYGSSHVA